MTPQPPSPETPVDPGPGVLSPRASAMALVALAALAAACLGYALTLLLGLTAGPWVVTLAAAGAVAAAGVPMALALLRLAEVQGHSVAAARALAPPAGMSLSGFMGQAEREFARARRYGTGAALVLVDVDRHARLCDARGAAAGRAVLTEMLRRTGPMLRTADALTAFGASQMAVFLVHADATGALDVAERIRERTEQLEVPYPPGALGLRLKVTASVGVAHLRPAHLSLQAMVDDALQAVAAARGAGGNCVRAAPVDTPVGPVPGPWANRRTRTGSQPPQQPGA